MGRRHHISREPLPWQEASHTECGRLITEASKVWTREVLERQVARDGRQVVLSLVCRNCLTAARHWATWDENPAAAMNRVLQGASYRAPLEPEPGVTAELRAIADLIVAHPEEFRELVVSNQCTTVIVWPPRAID